MDTLSFQEKSLWVMLVSLVGAYGSYFKHVLPGHGRDVRPDQIGEFIGSVVLLIVLTIIGHILIALGERRTEPDERDRLIALKGARAAGFVLATGVFASLCAAVAIPGNFAFTHVLLAFWVLSQMTEYAWQLALYRRGS